MPIKTNGLKVARDYPVMNDSLEGVFKLLPHPVALEDVNNAEKEQESLALVIPGGNSAGSENGGESSRCDGLHFSDFLFLTASVLVRRWAPSVPGSTPCRSKPASSGPLSTITDASPSSLSKGPDYSTRRFPGSQWQ